MNHVMNRNTVPARAVGPLETKDDNGDPTKVVEEVQRQVKSFGADIKGLRESIQKDLADVRKLAEEAKGAADQPETKAQIDALTTSVNEKHAALEELFKKQEERQDAIETAFRRSPTDTKSEKDLVKDAIAFYEAKAAASGNLAWRNRPRADNIDLEGYKAWDAAFGTYLRVSDDREIDVKALNTGLNPGAGYLMPMATSNRVVTKIFETSPIRQLATIETIGTDTLEIPIDTDEASCGWVGEEQTRAETDTPDVGTQRIPVHEIYAKPKATQKFLEDAAINVEQWLAMKVGDKMGRTEATAFVSGTGVNQPRGILTYASGSSGARKTILQVASGAATAIIGDVIVRMPLKLKSGYTANARWLMKRSTVEAVMLLKDGDGQYLWRPGLQAGVPSILAGYSVMMADDMPAVGAGTLPIAFGDFRAAYTIVDRLGITTLRDPYSAKPFVEFYSRKRVGGDVVDFEAYALVVVSA
jgi:HK97 family phage major capsid protein